MHHSGSKTHHREKCSALSHLDFTRQILLPLSVFFYKEHKMAFYCPEQYVKINTYLTDIFFLEDSVLREKLSEFLLIFLFYFFQRCCVRSTEMDYGSSGRQTYPKNFPGIVKIFFAFLGV